MKRYTKLYREKGAKGFYEPRRSRGAVVLTEEVLRRAQGLLNEDKELAEVGLQLGIKTNTLNKAVHAGKLRRILKKN